MQRSWRTDGDKITFIICRPLPRDQAMTCTNSIVQTGVHDAEDKMLGDVNLFISRSEDDPNTLLGELEIMIAEPEMQGKGSGRLALLAFIRYVTMHEEQILAEYQTWAGSQSLTEENGVPQCHIDDQSDGDSSESVEKPVAGQLRFAYLRARIGETNLRSLALFDHAGFQLQSTEPNYFGELELRMCGHTSGDINDRSATNKSGESLKDSSWKLLKYHRPADT